MKYWIVATLTFGLFLAGCSRNQPPTPMPADAPSASMTPEELGNPSTPAEQIQPSSEELSY